jgi:Family of unknown function (DUF5923)
VDKEEAIGTISDLIHRANVFFRGKYSKEFTNFTSELKSFVESLQGDGLNNRFASSVKWLTHDMFVKR